MTGGANEMPAASDVRSSPDSPDDSVMPLVNKPTVSVIVPTCNSEATIARAIDSALAQRGVSIEVVVADDGSVDATADIARRYGPPVLVVCQPNAGPAAARNLAIRHSSGEYLAFLDSDDEWLPGRVSEGIKPMLDDPSVGLTYCWSVRKTVDGAEQIRNLNSPSRNALHRLFWPDPIQCTPATTCRRDAVLRAGGFDEALTSREDKDLWIRIAEHFKVMEIPKPLVIVHERTDGYVFSNRYELDRIRGDYLRIIEKGMQRNPEKYRQQYAAIMGEAYRYWGQYALYYGFTRHARTDLFRSLRFYPNMITACYALISCLPEFLLRPLRAAYKV